MSRAPLLAAPAPDTPWSTGRPAPEGWEGPLLMGLTLLLFSFGLVALYSASAFLAEGEGGVGFEYALRQLGGGIVGISAMIAAAAVDYRLLRRLAWPFLIGSLLLLVVVVLPGTEGIAPRVNGARRWLHLGLTVQPSEVAKLALVVWTAALAVKKREQLHSFRRGFLPFLIVWLAVISLVSLQPNVSAALLLALLSGIVLFAAGGRIGHFVLLGILGAPAVWALISGASYRFNRVVAFLDPGADPAGASYQVYQSLVAVGSGGLTGIGFGESRQKFGFLPEPHNDFIFAMIAEEWGLLGVVCVLAFVLGIGGAGYRIAWRARDRFGYLLAIGMTALIVVSALIHAGVALALLPTTGITLPFVSYGRSSLVVSFIAVGVLLSVARVSRPGRTP